MTVDWTLTARWLAPILALFIGALLNRYLERRARLHVYLAHSSAVRVTPPSGDPFLVHTHTIVVRNAGGKAATNLRIGHRLLPNYSVYPEVPHETTVLSGGCAELRFPTLVPGEQISVTYLYYPPILWSDIHSYTKADDGFAREVRVLPTPQASPSLKALAYVLMAFGATALIVAAIHGIRFLRHILAT